jgi:glycosyltransferase involved in cell wall biosynthesis
MKKKLIIVLGMHRSGTSLITRALTAFSINLGGNLIGASPDNPKGFWENKEIIKINDELLTLIGSSYDGLKLHPINAFKSNEFDELKSRAISVLNDSFNEIGDVWAFKDPRICNLLDFWVDIFEKIDCVTNYIIVLRNPMSVADSLFTRNKIQPFKSYLLWQQHLISAVSGTKYQQRVIVNYDYFIDKPYQQLQRVASKLNLPLLPINSKVVIEFLDHFLEKDLRHSHYTLNDLSNADQLPPNVLETYSLLNYAANDAINIDSPEFQNTLEAIKGSLSDYYPYIKYINSLYQKEIELYELISKRDTKVDTLNQELTSLNQFIDERKFEIKRLDSFINELNIKVGERDVNVNRLNQEITSLKQFIDERKAEIGILTKTLGERDVNVNRLRRELIEYKVNINFSDHERAASQLKFDYLTKALSNSKSEINILSKELKLTFETLDERDVNVNRLNQEITSLNQFIDERKAEIGILTKTLGERDVKVNRLNQEITSLNQFIDERSIEINDVNLKYENILNSLSWKFTKPLRDLRLYLFDKPKKYLQTSGYKIIKSIWKKLALAEAQKIKLKNIILNKRLEARNIELFESSNEYVYFKKNEEDFQSKIKLICFYLPQFHEIHENNLWWGEGFTEWINVRAARPVFNGHYQPRIPDTLGYYNLLDEDVQKMQVELAKNYGIGGFCFYFYWFAGRTLLEDPVKNYLKSNNDLPFCLCWANENWTRTWDGLDNEILIAQSHSSDDDIAFIEYIARYFNDARYIRINNKPLLLVYRPNLLPSAKETSARWRDWCKNNGIGDIYIAYTQSFEAVDPNEYGFDAAIEFPPNNSSPPDLTDKVVAMNEKFKGKAYDMSIFEERSRNYSQPAYKLYRSVCPSWDNSARRKNAGGIFLNSTPHKYEQWLKNAIEDTVQTKDNLDERLIFINAWNEWAEGAYLEPDARYGFAYLQATKNALLNHNADVKSYKKIVVVAHDAHPHGAQFLALNIAKTLKESLFCEVSLICLGDGPLKAEYKKHAHFYDFAGKDPLGDDAHDLANKLYQEGYSHAIVNTAVSGHFLETLHKNKFECISLVHEMGGVLKQYNLSKQAKKISKLASKIIFASKEVADSYSKFSATDQKKVIIRPQGLYKKDSEPLDKKADHLELCKMLNLKSTAKIILGVGYADHRKGADLFIDIGMELIKKDRNAYMVWVGSVESSMQEQISAKLSKTPKLKNHFIFTGLQENTNPYYRGADIFALTSREDPFPSVVLESMNVGLPVVAFKGSGGINKVLENNCGFNVPMENVLAFNNAILKIIKNEKLKNKISEACAEVIKHDFSFRHYLFDLLDYLNFGYKKISVIVPNYNYEQYIDQRLETITKQNYPLYEVIFLDDCSKDRSLDKARNFLNQSNIDFSIHSNTKNSNSVVSQWKKGIDLASGDYIWIAEADDYSDQNFVIEIIDRFDDPEVALSYSESNQVNEDGVVLAKNYLDYLKDVSPSHWAKDFTNNGHNEIVNYFYIKNTIPNVSAVIFRKISLSKIFKEQFSKAKEYSVAHDWFVYYNLLNYGKISFNSKSLNYHRRHNLGVTIGRDSKILLDEIAKMQKYIRKNRTLTIQQASKADKYLEELREKFKFLV